MIEYTHDTDRALTMERLSERLQGFGFTKEEAEVYIFLSGMGPCPARVISRRFDTNRMKTYRTLKALEDKGLVQRIMGRPVRFVASPLGETLKQHIDELKSTLSSLEKSEAEILDEFGKLSNGMQPLLEEPRFRFFQGRQQIYDQLVQMSQRSLNEINIVTTGNDLNRLALMGIDDRLRAMAQEGRRVRLLTQVDGPEFGDVNYYADFAEVRHITLPTPIRFLIIDDSETLTTVAMDDSMSMTTQDDTGLWTNAQGYVASIKVFFGTLWSLAPEAETILEAVRTGQPPPEISVIRNREKFDEIFERMIDQSTSTIDIMIRRIKDLPVPLKRIQEAQERGIDVRIVTQLEHEGLAEINELVKSTHVVHSTTSTDLFLAVIDGREALLNIPPWEAMGQSVWSNIGAYVETMNQVFLDYWGRGERAEETISRWDSQRGFTEALDLIKSSLIEYGWEVESPGQIMGASGVNYNFNLVARKGSPEMMFGMDLLLEEKAFNHIIRMSARKIDLKPTKILIASKNPFETGEQEIAELYGVELVFESDLIKMAEKIKIQVERETK